MTTDFADLEVGLHRHDGDRYELDLRFSQSGSEGDIRPNADEPILASFDLAELRSLELEPAEYGTALAAMLFKHKNALGMFLQARASAASLGVPLRLRLLIGPSARELHQLRWEKLRDPEGGGPLITGENLLFSRYLSSGDWRRIVLRPRSSLRALAVAVGPADLAAVGLATVDVAGELRRARENLGDIPAEELGGRATVNAIVERLREGHDILYLACHGALVDGEPWLWLEDDDGKAARVAGGELVHRLNELAERPRLVVLASCQSSGDGALSADGSPLAALGPRLAESGIPAVIAMQGQVQMQTVAKFMPAFFRELARDGQIDRATAAARGAVRDLPDHWMPVLFMRLRGGRIWYEPGFGGDDSGYDRWEGLLGNIADGASTPIIGPLINEPIYGSPQDIAHQWSERYHFPLEPHQRDDLAQVAQYLSVTQGENLPRRELNTYLQEELVRRFGPRLPKDLDTSKLRDLMAEVSKLRHEQPGTDAYKALASLPFRVYITACTDSLLREALVAAGKQPIVDICRWKEKLVTLPSPLQKEPDYRPSAERPLVFHLFGVNAQPDSLVLTEDDYFDYLIGVSLNKKLIPEIVRDALVDRSLIFLGFQLENWNFRVLFRSMMIHDGAARRGRYANVAGQVVPEEGEFLKPDRARLYLQRYFGNASIDIFWGSVNDFIQELSERWARLAPTKVAASEEDDPFY